MTILYHAIEDTVVNTINATYAWCMMGRLDVIPSNIQQLSCILIGRIFYDMVLLKYDSSLSCLITELLLRACLSFVTERELFEMTIEYW